MENKRYLAKPREIDDVVNRKGASVYQTDAVLISSGAHKRRVATSAFTTKQYRVRRCSKVCLLRFLPARLV
jgi:hypothetical protein